MLRVCSRVSFAVVVLSGLIEFAAVARAASFNFDQFVFTQPKTQFGNSTGVTIAPQAFGEYTFGGSFMQFGDTLAFTNVSIICNGSPGGSCGSFDVAFEADNANASAGTSLSVFLSLDGFLDSARGFGRMCLAQESTLCPANLLGTDSIELDFGGEGVALSPNPSTFILDGGTFSILGLFHVTSMPADATGLQLPNSFDITLKAAAPDVVTPEPATVLLIGLGLAALGVGRKFFSRTGHRS
jgi:hypothetical protein